MEIVSRKFDETFVFLTNVVEAEGSNKGTMVGQTYSNSQKKRYGQTHGMVEWRDGRKGIRSTLV